MSETKVTAEAGFQRHPDDDPRDPRPPLFGRCSNKARDAGHQSAAAYACVSAALQAAMQAEFQAVLRTGSDERIDKCVRAWARIAARAMRAVGDELLSDWTAP